jgi:hypothetical protein
MHDGAPPPSDIDAFVTPTMMVTAPMQTLSG